tara:strand:- start:485 stop:1264 length:780 start_codon:yes stop_codon:yes gene_type:complete
MGGVFSFRIKKKNDILNWYVIRDSNLDNIVGNLAGLFSGGMGNFFDALTKYNISGDLYGELVLEDQQKLPDDSWSVVKRETFESGWSQNKTLGTVGSPCDKNCIKLDKIILLESGRYEKNKYCFILQRGDEKFSLYTDEAKSNLYPKLELYLSLYNGYEGESKGLLQSIINEEVLENKDTEWFKQRYGDFDGVGGWGIFDLFTSSNNEDESFENNNLENPEENSVGGKRKKSKRRKKYNRKKSNKRKKSKKKNKRKIKK